MDILKECDQATAEPNGEGDVSEEDAEWEQNCQQPDRGHVSVLMDISEESSFKDQEPYEFVCLDGWEQAIQGWGRAPPLSCLFQPQRRGKRARAVEPDQQHCVLCVDIKLCEPPESDSPGPSPKACCEPGLDDHRKRPHRPTHSSAPLRHPPCGRSARAGVPSPEQDPPSGSPGFGALCNATRQLALRDKMAEGKADEQHPAAGCPIFRKDGNATLAINSLAVLPPVRPSQTRQTKAVPYPTRRAEAAPDRGAETAEPGSRGDTPAGESNDGAERGERTRADGVPDTGASDGAYRRVVTSKYWPSHQSHHLLSAFSIPVPKRFEDALGSLVTSSPRSPNLLGRHLRQEPSRSSSGGHRLYLGLRTRSVRAAEPQLPILLGTRVLIPASAHRLL